MGRKGKRLADGNDPPTKRPKTNHSPDASPATNGAAAPKSLPPPRPFVENPTPDDRKYEAQLYELLASNDEAERLPAAQAIIAGLLDQNASEATLERHLDQRLFRGLASGRNAARPGFSTVITEVLARLFGKLALHEMRYPGLTFRKLLDIMVTRTQPVAVSGAEERDHYFGRLFGLMCFIQSNILFRDTDWWLEVLELLLELPRKKVWLRETCGWAIVQTLPMMDQEMLQQTIVAVDAVGLSETPEGVAIFLTALENFPDLELPSHSWGHPLSKKALSKAATVLKESTSDSSNPDQKDAKTKQANSTAQLHFVWDVILAYYAKTPARSCADFETFWKRVVDEGLFSRAASDSQKFRGFLVFQQALGHATARGDADMIKRIFSKHLLSCLMNQAAKKDRYLHLAAIKSLETIVKTAAAHPHAIYAMAKALLGNQGAFNFDQRTNSKTLEKLLETPMSKHGKKIVQTIQERFLAAVKETPKLATSYGLVYTTYISRLIYAPIKREALGSTAATVADMALKELISLGYTNPEWLPKSTSVEQLRTASRSRLETAFAELSRSGDMDYVCDAISSITLTSTAVDDAIAASLASALEQMETLREKNTHVSRALALLYAASVFQLYNEDPDSMEVLLELDQYSAQVGDGEGSEFLVETLLSIVSRPSKFMRKIAEEVFATFSNMISSDALALLTDPLAADETAEGQKALFDTADGIEAEEGEDDPDVENVEEAEIDSDVEFIDINAEEAEADGSEGENENSDAAADEVEALDKALAEVLKSHRLDKDKDAASSDSDSDMSDGEMMALDEKLAEVFQQRAKARPETKKQRKESRETVINFKHRVLDLAEIYVRAHPLAPRGMATLLPPLLALMRTTTTRALANRAAALIANHRKFAKKARGAGRGAGADGAAGPDTVALGDAEVEALFGVLGEIHGEAARDPAAAFAKAASAASLLVAGRLYDARKEGATVERIGRVYEETRAGGEQVRNEFFADWTNWRQNVV